jgi:hypothetical protein
MLSHILAIIGVLTAGIIYGTDALGALVGRPAWKKVDDRTLVMATGYMHYYGDRRFPVPGILSIAATVLTAVTSSTSSSPRPRKKAGSRRTHGTCRPAGTA